MNYKNKHDLQTKRRAAMEAHTLAHLAKAGGSLNAWALASCGLLATARRMAMAGKLGRLGSERSAYAEFTLPTPPLLPPAQPAG